MTREEFLKSPRHVISIEDISKGDTVKAKKMYPLSVYHNEKSQDITVPFDIDDIMTGYIDFIAFSTRPVDEGIILDTTKGYVFIQGKIVGYEKSRSGNKMFDFRNFDFVPIKILLTEKIKKGRF